MQIHFRTLGCRLNEAEIESWADKFQEKGHHLTSDPKYADLLVVNTCAVTQEAVKKSRQIIRRVHRNNPKAKLVISGCYPTLDKKTANQLPGIDLIINNKDKEKLVDISIRELNLETMPSLSIEPNEVSLFKRGRNRAFIKIQDGCRHKCTFCIVTVARGNERSRKINEITDEINKYHHQGIQEIVLTGVHVGGYGNDNDSNLYELIHAILNNTNIPRIRLASIEPWDLHEKFFSLFANERLMPHMHLPLQSGCNSTLKRMARRCKTDDFRRIANNARTQIKNFNITTDIIVGFPGETNEEWIESLKFIEEIGFSHIHIFTYSAREGTKASAFANQIETPIKKERSKELHKLSKSIRKKILNNEIGKKYSVLWESKDKDNNWFGYTDNYIKVMLKNYGGNIENKISKIKIIAVTDDLDHCIVELT